MQKKAEILSFHSSSIHEFGSGRRLGENGVLSCVTNHGVLLSVIDGSTRGGI